ncbi:MAG: helix-turn-helix domain-containing protein [Candidatus Xenobiia bacterium LiM19]
MSPLQTAIDKLENALSTATEPETIALLTDKLVLALEKQGKEEQKLWSLEQASSYLLIAPHTIRQHVSQEKIPFLKLNGAVRFDPVALKKWACTEKAVKPNPIWRKR